VGVKARNDSVSSSEKLRKSPPAKKLANVKTYTLHGKRESISKKKKDFSFSEEQLKDTLDKKMTM